MNRKLGVVLFVLTVIITLFLYCGTAMAATGGTYLGMDWNLDDDGVLTLGNGEIQTVTTIPDTMDSNGWPWNGIRDSIKEVKCNGTIVFSGSLKGMFCKCGNLVTADLSGFDTENVTTVSGDTVGQCMFYQCSKLVELDISEWNTSNIVDMRSLFAFCNSLSDLNISAWDVSSVTNMRGMFTNCSSLVELDLSDWNTSHVTAMDSMFSGCLKLASLDVSGWDTSSVTDMSSMFNGCSVLEDIDVANFDASLVTKMDYMFAGCAKIPSIDGSGWNVRSVTTMLQMCSGCEELIDVDFSGWDVSHVTKMYRMFQDCKNLETINLTGWNPSSATGIYYMFSHCESVKTLDLSNWNLASATNAAYMFQYCSELEDLDISGWQTPNLTDMRYMFYMDKNLKDFALADLDVSNVTTMERMCWRCESLEHFDLSGWNTSSLTNIDYLFHDCSGMKFLDLSGWDTSGITKLNELFANCSSLEDVNLSGWDTSVVKDMSYMFSGCESLTLLDLSHFDTSQVTDMHAVFKGCSKLESIDVSGFRTGSVTSMQEMFCGCKSLSSLDISHFNTANVNTMTWMFGNCEALPLLDVGSFDTAKVTDMSYMFYNCKSLEQLDLSMFDTEKVSSINNMFDGCEKLEQLDISGWNLSSAVAMSGMYQRCNVLCKVIIGDHNPFKGAGSASVALSTPPSIKDGIAYTRKWIREDKTFGPFTPAELRDNYTSAMAGTWVWEKVLTEYTITFVCTEDGYLGEMPPVTVEAAEDYTLPGNAFRVFGYVFDHWTDGTRRVWEDKAVIPADTYAAGAELTFTAVFTPRDTSVVMQDGAFDFSIKADEKALFSPIPASTAYQVYEQTPFGWNLIAQTDASGIIQPDEESEALFLNQYDPLKVTVRFAGTKLMDGSAAEVDSFNFLLYEDDNLIDISSVSEGGLIEFQPITYGQAGVHHYYIREAIGNDDTISYDTHVEEITVEITSDGVGHLYADVAMDEDEILFENASKPGYLVLSKANAAADSRTGTFLYEVQFTTENGQPYELFSGDITYEERDEEISELPIGQVVEKPKYTLSIWHMAKTDGVNPRLIMNESMTYSSGDVITLSGYDHLADTGHAGREYCLESVDAGFVKMADGTWKGVMPNHDLTVHLVYGQYARYVVRGSWNADPSATKPVLSVILYANGEQYMVNDHYTVGEECVFDMCPVYDTDGNVITYTSEMPEVEGYYISSSTGAEYGRNFGIMFGLTGQVIWDDFDNTYELRPADVSIRLSQNGSTRMFSGVTVDNNWQYKCSYYYDDDDYPITLTSVLTSPAVYAYQSYDYSTDETVDKYDLKLKVVNRQVGGKITWVDNNDSAGLRPESVTITVLRNNAFLFSRDLNASNGWMQQQWSSVYDSNNQLYEYEMQVDDIPGYRVEIDGNNITATLVTATISSVKWSNQINSSNNNSLPLRLATTFTRNRAYASVDELPVDAIKIDDGQTSSSIYFWMDGTDAKWWSDAEIVYAGQNGHMFYGCNNLTELDLSEWDTSQLSGLQSMFYDCSGLTSLNLTGWNTSNVMYFSNMFYRCSNLTSLDVSGFDTSSARSLKSMFAYCKKLTSLDLSNFDTANVTDLNDLFIGCEQLQSIDMTGWNTVNVTDMSGMFYKCQMLPSVNIAHFDTSNVTKMASMFGYCYELVSVDMSGWDTSHVTTLSTMFFDCTKLPSLNISSWNTASVTDMTSVFHYCYKLADLDVSGWNTSSVTSMKQMFYACHELTNLDLSGWNTSSVTNMNAMFGGGCSGLTSLNLSGWDTSAVTDMSFMFDRDSSLTELDLSSFDTSKVTKMAAMFQTCSNLEKIYVSDLWVTDAVEDNGSSMFSGVGLLMGGNGTPSNSYYVDVSRAHIDGGVDNPGYFTYKAAPTQP